MPKNTYNLKSGDILSCAGHGLGSAIINITTAGIPNINASHVALACRYAGEILIFESTSCNPESWRCAIRGESVKGVQCHSVEQFLDRTGRVYVHRIYRDLYNEERTRLVLGLVDLLGKPYDYIQAGRSGVGGPLTRGVLGMLKPSDCDLLFCSELISYMFSKIGVIHRTDHAISPNSLLRYLRWRDIIQNKERIK